MAEYEKRGYLLENFRLFHLRSERNSPVDFHYHEFCKLLLLVSGSGSYVVDGHRYALQSGDAVLIGSRSVHRPEMEDGTAYERIIIYISPEFLQKASCPGCDLLDHFSGKHGHVLRLREQQRKALFAMAAALERELAGEEYGREILCESALLRLLVFLGRGQQQSDAQTPAPIEPKNDRILALLRYMDAHLAEDLNVDVLAEQCYISKYHLMRLFHRETGTTIHTYLTRRRLMYARELIEGGMRSTEACYRCGFRSYSSFTRAYGKHYGMTPTGRTDTSHQLDGGFE